MKILKVVFNRITFISIAIIAQMALIVLISLGLVPYPVFAVLSVVAGVVIFLRVMTRDINPSQQLLWVTTLLLFPVVGVALYVMIGDAKWPISHKKFMKRVISKQMPAVGVAKSEDYPEKYAGQINYLTGKAWTNAYKGCRTEYFPNGESYFKSLVEDLERAEKFIFLEFFIIERGVMWNTVLEVLERKAASGVEVRVLYDDIGCAWKLPSSYHKTLRQKGIKCVRFNKFTPFVTNLHNNRDHRKIVVIDGKVGYTGGINLADEYINGAENDFYWKDTAVRIEGNAVNELTEMLLHLFEISDPLHPIQLEDYANTELMDCGEGGLVVPFGTGPEFMYNCHIAEECLLNIITGADRTLVITTPYLILDYALNRALVAAVARGVKVKIVIPDVPDKKLVYLITKSNAEYLKNNGVEIYRSRGSFLHAKSIVADGEVALVGTINMDYRSFLHHFENAVWMCGTEAVKRVDSDVQSLCCEGNRFDGELKLSLFGRLVAATLKVFTPLI